ncbi:hypothetical protein ACSSS7_001858 [Eimeria intestinalis]
MPLVGGPPLGAPMGPLRIRGPPCILLRQLASAAGAPQSGRASRELTKEGPPVNSFQAEEHSSSNSSNSSSSNSSSSSGGPPPVIPLEAAGALGAPGAPKAAEGSEVAAQQSRWQAFAAAYSSTAAAVAAALQQQRAAAASAHLAASRRAALAAKARREGAPPRIYDGPLWWKYWSRKKRPGARN